MVRLHLHLQPAYKSKCRLPAARRSARHDSPPHTTPTSDPTPDPPPRVDAPRQLPRHFPHSPHPHSCSALPPPSPPHLHLPATDPHPRCCLQLTCPLSTLPTCLRHHFPQLPPPFPNPNETAIPPATPSSVCPPAAHDLYPSPSPSRGPLSCQLPCPPHRPPHVTWRTPKPRAIFRGVARIIRKDRCWWDTQTTHGSEGHAGGCPIASRVAAKGVWGS